MFQHHEHHQRNYWLIASLVASCASYKANETNHDKVRILPSVTKHSCRHSNMMMLSFFNFLMMSWLLHYLLVGTQVSKIPFFKKWLLRHYWKRATHVDYYLHGKIKNCVRAHESSYLWYVSGIIVYLLHALMFETYLPWWNIHIIWIFIG